MSPTTQPNPNPGDKDNGLWSGLDASSPGCYHHLNQLLLYHRYYLLKYPLPTLALRQEEQKGGGSSSIVCISGQQSTSHTGLNWQICPSSGRYLMFPSRFPVEVSFPVSVPITGIFRPTRCLDNSLSHHQLSTSTYLPPLRKEKKTKTKGSYIPTDRPYLIVPTLS